MFKTRSRISSLLNHRISASQPIDVPSPSQRSLIETTLPPEIILVIFEHCTPPHALCFALCSHYLWDLYLSITSEIPSLWTPVIWNPDAASRVARVGPKGYPHLGIHIPLGSLLTEWIGPENYRMLRPAEYTPPNFHRWVAEYLPPFFIRRTWQDKLGLLDTDGRLIDMYHQYWRVERDGRKIYPHPKRTTPSAWAAAARRAAMEDAKEFETFEDWASFWIHADRALFYTLKNDWGKVRRAFKERVLAARGDSTAST